MSEHKLNMNNKDTLVNKFEKAGLVTVLIIWILRGAVGPAFNFALLITTTLLAIYYLWFGFFVFNKMQPLDLLYQKHHRAISRFHIAAGILMGIVLSYSLIAILFGFHFFPGMKTALISGGIILLFFTIFIAAYHSVKKRHQEICKRFYSRAAIIGFVLALLLFSPVDMRLSILFKDHPEFQEAYLEYLENPEDDKSIERLREERSKFR